MNPFSGCLSAILQIVILFSVFFMVQSPLTYMTKVDPAVINQYKEEIQQNQQDNGRKNVYPEIQIIKEKGSQDERVHLNMEFLGLDLSSVPISELSDYKVYIIPLLYVISSFISIKVSNNMSDQNKKKDSNKEPSEMDAVMQANKSMMYVMPIMSVSISMVAPLGLALYWLVSNVLMIGEKVILNKVMDSKEE